MVAIESETLRNALTAFDKQTVALRAGRVPFDSARTALDKQTVAFGAVAMECGERPQ